MMASKLLAMMLNNFDYQIKGLGFSKMFEKQHIDDIFDEDDESFGRVWDNVDYVVSSGTDQFFVMTNVILTPNQIRKRCPEDHHEIPSLNCGNDFRKTKKMVQMEASRPKARHRKKLLIDQINTSLLSTFTNASFNSYKKTKNECKKDRIKSYKSHGIETGKCVRGDRSDYDSKFACEIKGWCPVEKDILPNPKLPLISGTENFTVLIKNTISFPLFGSQKYHRNNMPKGLCLYEPENDATWLCPIFRLQDIVTMARGKAFNHFI